MTPSTGALEWHVRPIELKPEIGPEVRHRSGVGPGFGDQATFLRVVGNIGAFDFADVILSLVFVIRGKYFIRGASKARNGGPGAISKAYGNIAERGGRSNEVDKLQGRYFRTLRSKLVRPCGAKGVKRLIAQVDAQVQPSKVRMLLRYL